MVVLARCVDEACHILYLTLSLKGFSVCAMGTFQCERSLYAIVLTPADPLSFRPHINS